MTILLAVQQGTYPLQLVHRRERIRKGTSWAVLPQPAEQRSSGCPPVTLLYTPSSFLLTVETALPMGHLHIRPEDTPGSAKTILLKTLHAPAAVRGCVWQGWIPHTEVWAYAMTEIFCYCLHYINVKSYTAFSRSRAGTLHDIRWVAEWKMHITWKLSSKLILKRNFGKICHHFNLYRWIKIDTCKYFRKLPMFFFTCIQIIFCLCFSIPESWLLPLVLLLRRKALPLCC